MKKRIITTLLLACVLFPFMRGWAQGQLNEKRDKKMDFFEVLESRKSVRAYLDKEVEMEKVRRVVEAGNMAAGTPTAGKRYFNVVTDRGLIQRIADKAKEVMRQSPIERARQVGNNPNYVPTFGAPVVVFISVVNHESPVMAASALQNAAAAGENMLLAARALGLGSCYVGSPTMALSDAGIRREVKLPEGVKPVCAILVGYAVDDAPHAPRKSYPDNIIYANQ